MRFSSQHSNFLSLIHLTGVLATTQCVAELIIFLCSFVISAICFRRGRFDLYIYLVGPFDVETWCADGDFPRFYHSNTEKQTGLPRYLRICLHVGIPPRALFCKIVLPQ